MCPDRQLISLYIDDELPSPWKEKLEAHIESCSECQSVLSGYRLLKDGFQELPRETVQAAEERVWKKLPIPAPTGRRQLARMQIWSRSITLPVPAAAAAVLAIILFFAFAGLRNASPPPAPETMAAIGLDDRGVLPIQDMTDLLQYLSDQDSGDFMVIRLPESRNFSRIGEPALVNAADYSRRTSSR